MTKKLQVESTYPHSNFLTGVKNMGRMGRGLFEIYWGWGGEFRGGLSQRMGRR